jgi:branched-chain amino acid transport system ATP-binding protein
MLLQVKELNVSYGGVKALLGVSLDIEEGEIVSVLGGNGAGKSTLANTICGLVTPRSGEVWFKGKKISGLSPSAIVALGIVQIPEGRGIFGTMTVLDNLKIGSYLHPSKQELLRGLENIYEIFPILRERSRQLGASLSGGEQQMLAIGRGLMARPRLLIMDEPTLGLSPLMRKEVGQVTKKINLSGTSIIFVEQDAQMALRISHKGIVLQNGQVTMQGSSQELLNNPTLKESYLS